MSSKAILKVQGKMIIILTIIESVQIQSKWLYFSSFISILRFYCVLVASMGFRRPSTALPLLLEQCWQYLGVFRWIQMISDQLQLTPELQITAGDWQLPVISQFSLANQCLQLVSCPVKISIPHNKLFASRNQLEKESRTLTFDFINLKKKLF